MRFSIVQILMLVALVALLVVFWQSESRGPRELRLESMVFSPDGSKLAVTTFTGRRTKPIGIRTVFEPDEHVDPARDLFTIEAGSGSIRRTVLRESMLGDGSMLFSIYFSLIRSSPVAFNPKTQQLAVVSFANKHVVYLDAEVSLSEKLELGHPVESIAFSKTGKWLGCLGDEVLTVFSAVTLEQVRQMKEPSHISFPLHTLGGVGVLFSNDETRVLKNAGPHFNSWEIMSSAKPTLIEISADFGLMANHVEIAPDGSMLHCANVGIVVTDSEGELRKKLVGLEGANDFSFSSDYSRLLFLESGLVKAYGLADNFREVKHPEIPANDAVLSPNGKQFAVAKGARQIALHDFETGKQVWQVQLPERSYVTWPFPAAGIALWCLVTIGLYFRSRRVAKKKAVLAV